MINGNEYAWEDMQIVVEGKALPLEGVVEINYEAEKDHTNIHGRGAKPVAMGRGKEDFSGCNLVLLQNEFEAMQRSMPAGKNVTHRAPFTITVAYAPEGGVETVDQLTYVRIKKFKKGMKTGDGNQTINLELVVGDILYNI